MGTSANLKVGIPWPIAIRRLAGIATPSMPQPCDCPDRRAPWESFRREWWLRRSLPERGASCAPCFRTKARIAGSCTRGTWSFWRPEPLSASACSWRGNRTGKTETGAYEMACHLTGQYPDWWQGRRFSKPVNAWACGTTNGTTRDIVQEKLLGPEGAHGTGMIPAHTIVKV